jgi:spermidine synthase
LEAVVLVIAIMVPLQLAALIPVLRWAYHDGAGGFLFPTIRLLSCFVLVLVPAVALGATFPVAVRWFAHDTDHPGRAGGALYAANTVGATVGVLTAGFVLIPAIGISGTTLVGVAASGLSIACAIEVARRSHTLDHRQKSGVQLRTASQPKVRTSPERRWLAATVLGLSGLATFIYEIAWVRVLSLVIGPTTYAFAATLAAIVGGIACGSTAGAWVAGRARRPALWLAVALAGTAIATSWATSFVGTDLPRLVADQLLRSPYLEGHLLTRHAPRVVALILPTAIGLGVSFPLALEIVGGWGALAGRLGMVYAINTLASLAGSLIAGFALIPLFGLQHTLQVTSGVLVVAALIVLASAHLPSSGRMVGLALATFAVVVLIGSPSWDRELLASGVYKYPADLSQDVDPEIALKAGTLLYYRDGAAATVSVKRLAGTRALSIDGKVDASTFGDMLTQKALAHLPLLLHPNPREALVIGLGSGVTAASALIHPITQLDVVEISPEVVDASRYFAAENRNALEDPRTRLVLGDGRSHLLLSNRKYDVIVSEPSNPWMAGVAALFTREFFLAARERLAPDGIICQWAHTYDISEADFRSIVATFLSVFPHGTMWLIGEGDVLLVASAVPLDSRLETLEQTWRRPGVAVDLREVSAFEPFALLSSFAAGPHELQRYAAGAALQTDDRMALEFSGPRALYAGPGEQIAATLRQLLEPGLGPPAIRGAWGSAGAAQWRNRGAMMLAIQAGDEAYRNYVRALAEDPIDAATLDGVVRAAVVTDREPELLDRLQSLSSQYPQQPVIRVAVSKLLATTGAVDEAIAVATEAANVDPNDGRALEQLASILADIGDADRLGDTVVKLQKIQPAVATTLYYAAQARFLVGQFDEAIRLGHESAARDPGYARAHNLVGASYASLGQREPARQAFDAALRADARDAAVYVNLGLLELESGNRDAAADHFAEALALDPDLPAARQGLAQAR